MNFTMSNTLTREKKRKLQEKDKGIIDFIKIQHHIFPDLIMDGTGLHHFEERHCESCLVREIIDKEGKKKKVYSHHVLEAKLVLADNIIISLGTEFIENEKEDISKQDCGAA
jgi:hypothetical protein